MYIGIISRWNATCGVSMHAELICNEFLKMGYKVKVFAPYIESANRWWHHKVIREEDEEFVVRCYDELNPNMMGGRSFEEDRVLSEELDILVVESHASLPYREVEKVIRRLKNKKSCSNCSNPRGLQRSHRIQPRPVRCISRV